MRYSVANKFILICMPKTGSTSLRSMLTPHSDIRWAYFDKPDREWERHVTAAQLKPIFEAKQLRWKDFWSFTAIRNPWAIQVSSFNYFRPDENYREFWADDYFPRNPISFEQFVRNKVENNIRYENVTNFAFDTEGNRLLNQIILLEHFNQALPELWRRLGLPFKGVERKNVRMGSRRPYQDWYSKELRELVASHYAENIEMGGYTFDGGFRPYVKGQII